MAEAQKVENTTALRVLLVDDDEDFQFLLQEQLSELNQRPLELEWVSDYEDALTMMLKKQHHAYLIDYCLGFRSGLELIREAGKIVFDAPMILLTGRGDYSVDLKAMEAGAADYLTKDGLEPIILERTIRYAVERKRAQRENQRLLERVMEKQKNESLGLLAGGLAHDLNNILSIIKGNVGLFKMETALNHPMKNVLENIEKGVSRATSLSNQMLAYSGRAKFVVRVIHLPQLVSEITSLLGSSVSSRARIQFNFSSDVPPVEADQTQVQQLVMNLLTNAVEAMNVPGKIFVSTSMFRVDEEFLKGCLPRAEGKPGDYVCLEVKDNGIGMDANTLKRIFDPFFTTKSKGRGLGLAAVIGIIQGHKGLLKVESESGKGTTFRILLPPTAKKEKVEEKVENNTMVPTKTGTVLVVDDEEGVLEVAKLSLERFGYQVLTALDGEEALEIVQSEKVDLTLLDMTMPGMSGDDVFMAIKRGNPGAKVILTSGYHESELAGRIAGEGWVGFLQKPYGPMDLVKKVQSVFEN